MKHTVIEEEKEVYCDTCEYVFTRGYADGTTIWKCPLNPGLVVGQDDQISEPYISKACPLYEKRKEVM